MIREEPRIIGEAAIRVASSGIANYPAVTRAMAQATIENGATIMLGQHVTGMREDNDGVTVTTRDGKFRAKHAIVCAGLMADRLARMCNLDLDFRIVPFRGEYFRLPASKNDIVRHLIYPVPDPSLPFLGVHLTRMIGGYVTVGPNAVLAMAREGYRWRDVNLTDLAGMASFGGFWKMLKTYGPSGISEVRNSLWKRGYLALCQKYCPELQLADLQPYDPRLPRPTLKAEPACLQRAVAGSDLRTSDRRVPRRGIRQRIPFGFTPPCSRCLMPKTSHCNDALAQ